MFNFLKYIEPATYCRLMEGLPSVLYNEVDNTEKKIGYKNQVSEKLDVLFYNLKSGEVAISQPFDESVKIKSIQDENDNYIFISRYYSYIHLIKILIIRLICLKNPIKEICYFMNSLKYKRVKIIQSNHADFNQFDSTVVQSNPLVSVIIPTLNRYEYLNKVLIDLENQSYKNFEVIICDQSDRFNNRFFEGWDLKIKWIFQEEKALWLARNNAIKKAQGEFILLSEDDVELPVNWILDHLKCIDFFKCKISAGVFHRNSNLINKKSDGGNKFCYSQQFPTGNSMVHKSVFEKIGLFDRQFEKQRMGDGEFGLRAWQSGFKIISNPKAFIIDVKAPTGGLRQMGSWDSWRPISIFSPRPIPSVLYYIRKYFGDEEAKWYLLKNVPQSFVPYKFKNNRVIKLINLMAFPVYSPLAFWAVVRSWKLATLKLKQGSLIENFISN